MRAVACLTLLVALALPAWAQSYEEVPTWEEAIDQPWRAAQYPAWEPPDGLPDDSEVFAIDDEESLVRELVRMVREIRRLAEENEELKAKVEALEARPTFTLTPIPAPEADLVPLYLRPGDAPTFVYLKTP